MKSLLLVALAATSVLPLPVRAETLAPADDTAERFARIEAALPAVSKDGRTLQMSLQEWMDALAVPGLSLAVIDDHRIVWVKGYGVTATGVDGAAVTPTTLFQAASIAKPVTALAVLHEVESGTFALDADINDYLQTWKLPRSAVMGEENVTIRRLLAHTGGVTTGAFQGYERGSDRPGIVQVLEGVAPATNAPARVDSKPGSEVAYSGLGYTLLQLGLADRLERPFAAIMQDTVLGPLAMHDSLFAVELPDDLAARAARGHLGTGVMVDGGWREYPELAAAGLWTTPGDLARLAIATAESRRGGRGFVLSPAMTRQMLTVQQGDMGLGFLVRADGAQGWFAHSGGNAGYNAHFEMLADSGDGIAIMANSDGGQALASLIIAAVADEYAWPLPDRRTLTPARIDRLFARFDSVAARPVRVAVDAQVLARYVGRYQLAPEMVFAITLDGDQLQLQLADQPRFPLFPKSETGFFLEAVDAQVTFVVDDAGKATGLVLHQGGRDQPAPRIE